MDELKPCPFCGGKAEMLYTGKYECFVHCRRGCVEQTRLYKAKCSAIKAWNRRASIEPERKTGKWIKGGEQPYFRKHFDIVVCSNCNKRGEHRWNFCPNCGARMNEGSVKE